MSSIYIQYLNKYDLFTCQKMSVFKALNFQETTNQDWAKFSSESKTVGLVCKQKNSSWVHTSMSEPNKIVHKPIKHKPTKFFCRTQV